MVRLFVRTRTHTQLSGVTIQQHHAPLYAVAADEAATRFVVPGWAWGAVDSGGPSVIDTIYACLSYTPFDLGIDQIGMQINTAVAGSTIRLGAYAASVGTGLEAPGGALLFDAGTISSASTGDKNIGITETLPAGWNYIVFVASHAGIAWASPDVKYFISAPISGNMSGIASLNQIASVHLDSGSAAELPSVLPSRTGWTTGDFIGAAVRST